MCGRFTLRTNPAEVARLFSLATLPALTPRYNIAPGQLIACIRREEGSTEPRLVQLKWGLVPVWAKQGQASPLLINARGETAASKPAFRAAFRHRRCLIPADGFYEWQTVGGRKQPWYITRVDRGPFAMAGLWEAPVDEAAPGTCAVITTTANDLMAPLHDRMPVILSANQAAEWLDPQASLERLQAQVAPCPAGDLTATAVSTLVNNWRNERVECTQPAQKTLFD